LAENFLYIRKKKF